MQVGSTLRMRDVCATLLSSRITCRPSVQQMTRQDIKHLVLRIVPAYWMRALAV